MKPWVDCVPKMDIVTQSLFSLCSNMLLLFDDTRSVWKQHGTTTGRQFQNGSNEMKVFFKNYYFKNIGFRIKRVKLVVMFLTLGSMTWSGNFHKRHSLGRTKGFCTSQSCRTLQDYRVFLGQLLTLLIIAVATKAKLRYYAILISYVGKAVTCT